jgi:hypothetical protein
VSVTEFSAVWAYTPLLGHDLTLDHILEMPVNTKGAKYEKKAIIEKISTKTNEKAKDRPIAS